ncbi:MAG TPA: hypothetical protein EYP58_05330 [bacterium (Candidatus Stahlbacteria)]|nr:hypothetical protein [Candidatus Stahlbacteria bacterium]
MNDASYAILIPVVSGLLAIPFRRIGRLLSGVGLLASLYLIIKLFTSPIGDFSYGLLWGIPISFRLDPLGLFISLACVGMAFLIYLFSIRTVKYPNFFIYTPLIAGFSIGAALAANLVFLLFFWGSLLVVVYGLLLLGENDTSQSAQKALFILGFSDFAMLLGIALLIFSIRNYNLVAYPRIPLERPEVIASFLLISVGAIGKAGAIPLHTWIPAVAKNTPASTMALIPASLDKILGIYLLVRISVYLFDLNSSMPMRNILMIIGSITVVAAVMMALIQKEAQRLLSFHAVSQVGYMVLGIGTGIPIGIAGGLFHMINNVIYKSALFLSIGSVKHRTGTTDLEKLGGMSVNMPITFFSFFIAAMAISGIPPLNGFFSKWMIYQGVIKIGGEGNLLWPIYLTAATFGSVLTLASFMKLTHSVFLGSRPKDIENVKEVPPDTLFSPLVMSIICLIFGIFAIAIPLKHLIFPSLQLNIEATGSWRPDLATVLIIIGIGIGLLIYLLGTALKPKESKIFVGGEDLILEEGRIPGTHFYTSLKDIYLLNKLYRFGSEGAFDIYNHLIGILKGIGVVSGKVVDFLIQKVYEITASLADIAGVISSNAHTGILPNYLGWILLGFIVLMLFVR